MNEWHSCGVDLVAGAKSSCTGGVDLIYALSISATRLRRCCCQATHGSRVGDWVGPLVRLPPQSEVPRNAANPPNTEDTGDTFEE